MSTRSKLTAVAAAAALALTACGGGDAGSGSASTTGTSSGAFPVSVEHKYGTTEIKAEPTKVVTLGLSDQEPVLALGVKPVGVVDWFKERPYGNWPWTKQLWGDTQPEIVGERDEYNLEKVAALKPDLIVAVYSGMNQEQYDTLSKIAPVVAQPKGFVDYGAPWQEQTKHIAKALGKSAKAQELIDGVAKRFADAKAAHPEWSGKTVVVADSFKPGEYSAFAPTDPKAIFMRELGFTLVDEIGALAGERNVAQFSEERFDLLDADRLVWLTSDVAAQERVKAVPAYQRLDVVTGKRDLFLTYMDPPIGAAMSFNTVLSVPYGIDQVVPLLEQIKS
ncbi:iron-siderophore ABC transporter substrate-binding protein [Saccharothrix coeruleofusca]|uniref:Iron siderophore-binding protein n=1 Tax=Saccharothrix coeruleofusca TaxID=33919 RepID=A0A918AQZ9_9PSEU|nr:iron-siderophore ABC transporter substrate-binding protein [Saccharothrix coeruleofusca]MBP2337648.1 iron complex transport system substrate-binding protein [Saccharothrix coeruleofusca]GGP64433.1 iron siderophore-binding protein [Saccharothrix coeruleofusca]